jgi:hypothetical protein
LGSERFCTVRLQRADRRRPVDLGQFEVHEAGQLLDRFQSRPRQADAVEIELLQVGRSEYKPSAWSPKLPQLSKT